MNSTSTSSTESSAHNISNATSSTIDAGPNNVPRDQLPMNSNETKATDDRDKQSTDHRKTLTSTTTSWSTESPENSSRVVKSKSKSTAKASNRKRQKVTKNTQLEEPQIEVQPTQHITLNEPESLRLSVYEKFIRHFIHIFNDHDSMSMLYLVFYPCCTTDLVNVIRYWPRSNPLAPPSTNPMGWLNYLEFHGFNDITNHCRVAFCMNPDLTTVIQNVKFSPTDSNGRKETKVFLSFEGTGTSVIPATQVLVQAFEYRKKIIASTSTEQNTCIVTHPPKCEELQDEEVYRCFLNLYKFNLQTVNPQSILTDDIPISSMSQKQLQSLISKINQNEGDLSEPDAINQTWNSSFNTNQNNNVRLPRIRRCGDVFLMDLSVNGYLIAHFNEYDRVHRIEAHYFEQTVEPSSQLLPQSNDKHDVNVSLCK